MDAGQPEENRKRRSEQKHKKEDFEKTQPQEDQTDLGEREERKNAHKESKREHGKHTHSQRIPNRQKIRITVTDENLKECHQSKRQPAQKMEEKNQVETWKWKDSVSAP